MVFNNILPATLTTAVIFTWSFLIWCLGIGADHNYFFEWLPPVGLSALVVGTMWGLSEGDMSDYHYSE